MKTYLLIICSLIAMSLNAQSHRFADTTAEWNVDIYDPWAGAGSIKYNASGDTLINGRLYQKMKMSPRYESWHDIDDYVRQDSTGKVFSIYYDTTEYLIYDFGRNVGDTVIINNITGEWPAPYPVVVEGIDSVYIGKMRKKISIRSCQYEIDTFTWLEGIGLIGGNYGHPFHPLESIGVIDATTYKLVCFHENGERLYLNPSYDSCLYVREVGIKDKALASSGIFPNPSTNIFKLTLNQQPQPNTTLLIQDALGRVVKREELVSSTQQISVADLPNGMYTYAVTQNSVRQASGKLVISH